MPMWLRVSGLRRVELLGRLSQQRPAGWMENDIAMGFVRVGF